MKIWGMKCKYQQRNIFNVFFVKTQASILKTLSVIIVLLPLILIWSADQPSLQKTWTGANFVENLLIRQHLIPTNYFDETKSSLWDNIKWIIQTINKLKTQISVLTLIRFNFHSFNEIYNQHIYIVPVFNSCPWTLNISLSNCHDGAMMTSKRESQRRRNKLASSKLR